MVFGAVLVAILRGSPERARTLRVNAIAFIPGMTAVKVICLFGPAPYAKIFPFFADPNHRHIPPSPFRKRGRRPSSLDVGAGCGGRVCVARRAIPMRTAKSCGP